MNVFQDDLIAHISTANYDKLLKAVDGIIELYNESVRHELKTTILKKWQDVCESMTFFTERMDMGDESEQVASEIEESLVSVFETDIENRLHEVDIDGRTSASIEDFNSVNEIFDTVVKKVQALSDDFNSEAERLGEENEFYRFLIPIVLAYSSGICSYFKDATKNLENLEDSYISKMVEKRDAVQESKQEVDLSSLLDFSDLAYAGMGNITKTVANDSNKKPKKNSNASDGKSCDTSTNKYDRLIQALRQFDGQVCTYPELKKKYDEHLSQFHKKLEMKVKAEYDKRNKTLQQYHKQLEQQLQTRYKQLDGWYIKGTISLQQAEYLYAESCAKAEQLYSIRERALWIEYQNICQQANQMYNGEVARCNQIANKVLKNQQSTCRGIYEHKQEFIARLKSESAEQCVEELRKIVYDINHKCTHKCNACIEVINALRIEVTTNDEGIIKDIVRELDPLNENLKGFKRRKDKLSWEDNLRATNPGFYQSLQNSDKKYTHNCQRCVMAYEVRCRGFDVTAKERQLSDDELPIMKHPNGWPSVFVDKNGNTPIPETVDATTTQQAISNIESKMASYGDGARAIIRIGRAAYDTSRLCGHVFIAEQINGRTVFIDPQTASYKGAPIDARRNFGNYNNQIGLCKPITVKVCDPRCIKRGKSARIGDCYNCSDDGAPKNSSVYTKVEVLPEDIRILRIDNLKITKRILDCCNG